MLDYSRNMVKLFGCAGCSLIFSHESMGELFFIFELRTMRTSGAWDTANVIIKESIAKDAGLFSMREGDSVGIEGTLRSYNNKSGKGARLIITVFAGNVFSGHEFENTVMLHGAVCRDPVFRTTPLGRDICDIILAVNRRCGKADYLPCVLWGSTARMFSAAPVGTELLINGRLQSRNYIKRTGDAEIEKTAFEVSVFSAEGTARCKEVKD